MRTGTARRRRTVLAGAGAALLALGLAGPAVAEDGDADDTGYDVGDAEEIEGTSSTADAPQLEAGGHYLDTLEAEDELYYRVELDDASDYYFSAVAVPEPGADVVTYDEFSVQLQTTGGDSCGPTSSRRFSVDDADRPVGTAVFRTIERGGDCQESGSYLLVVERDDTSDTEDWELELRVRAEPAATDGTAPPAEDDVVGPDDVDEPSGADPREVSGGTGFNDAQPIGDGAWRDSVEPGQTRFYRVPLDWHQQLVTVVDVGNAPVDGDLMMTQKYDGLSLETYSPFQTLVAQPDTVTYDGTQANLGTMTFPVAYENRYDADHEYVEHSRVAGWYYLAIHLHEEVDEFLDADEVDLTLRVEVHGDPAEGPEYAGDFTESGFGVTDDDLAQAADGKDDATVAAEQRQAQQLLGYASMGTGAAVVLVLAAWLLVARRRAAATDAAGGPAPSPPGPGAAPGGPHPG